MSMNATFVQVGAAELTRIQGDPALAEALFEEGPSPAAAMTNLTGLLQTFQARVQANGPDPFDMKLLAGEAPIPARESVVAVTAARHENRQTRRARTKRESR